MDAPRLPDDLPWLGSTGRPVLGDGRVGVVLFWSATSVHCERALAILDWIDVRFATRALVLASVHVPRADGERGSDFVSRACARFGIRHPVAVDDAGAAASAWGVRRLPTLAIVDATGALRFQGGGEPDRDRLTAAIGALLDEAAAPPPPPPSAAWPRAASRARTALRFPTGLAVDADRGVLWIADTGRDRVVAIGLEDHQLRHVVGTGRPGATDGDFGYAAFARPRGLCAANGRCYVADAGNHSIRRIDPDGAGVETVLGQGRLVADRAGGLAGASQGIASPWDVELCGDDLYIAMAGVHQVWQLTLGDGYAYAWSGSGQPGHSDGMRHDAAYAQPAGLAYGCDELAIADADQGAVRIAGLSTQHVHTLHGGPSGGDPLAQPRALAWYAGDVLVADSLHDRVVRIRVRDGTLEDVITEGLCGPEGLAVHGDQLYVADTAHHRLVRVDLTSGAVDPVVIVDPHPDHPEPEPAPIRLLAAARVAVCFPMPMPADERLHPEASGHALVRAVDFAPLARPFHGAVDPENSWGTLRGVETGPVGGGEIEIAVRYATCHDLDAEPHVQELHGRFRVELEPDGPEAADLPFA